MRSHTLQQLVLVVVALGFGGALAAQEAALQAIVTPDTALIARVDLSRVTGAELAWLARAAATIDGEAVPDVDEWEAMRAKLQAAGATQAWASLRAPVLVGESLLARVAIEVSDQSKAVDVLRVASASLFRDSAWSWRQAGALVVATRSDAPGEQGSAPRAPAFAKALAGDGDAPLAVVLLLAPDQRRALTELLPASYAVLNRDSLSGVLAELEQLTLAYASRQSATVELRYPSDQVAKRAAAVWPEFCRDVAELLKSDAKLAELLAQNTAGAAAPQGDRLAIKFDEAAVTRIASALQDASQREDAAAQRRLAMNRLKQIGLAMHNYHDRNKRFPDAAISTADGKPLLSWRVALLPYLEQANLYRQFKLDEPWDSEHNKQLIDKMPDAYRATRPASEGKTPFVAAIGAEMAFPNGKGRTIREFTDGTSNTILVVEADPDHEVIWTKPADATIDLVRPKANLGGHYGNGLLALVADGSARFIADDTSDAALKVLFTAAARDVDRQQ